MPHNTTIRYRAVPNESSKIKTPEKIRFSVPYSLFPILLHN
ncbi:hypothetical protein CKA32_005937 [Geitlerinema sp. FC II]|nr:hypothetical protein CKA32_005937 [Geitlerinema sp. FC II]